MMSAYIDLLHDCNLNCVFCSRKPGKRNISLAEAKELLKKYKGMGYQKAYFTGGEPLLYPHLEEAVKFATELGFETAIQTNGTLMDKKRAKSLKEAGLGQAIFSIHSHIPIIEDRLMNGMGVLKRQLAGLENAHKAGMYSLVTVVVVRQNYRLLPEYFEFFIRNYPFVEHYVLNFVDYVGRCRKNPWVVPKVSETERFLAKALLKLKKAGKSFRVERVPLCYMLEFAEYNTELRRIISGETLITKRESEFKSYTDKYFEVEYVRGKACKSCFLNKICPGLDKEYVEIHGTDEMYPVFVDPKKIIKKAGPD